MKVVAFDVLYMDGVNMLNVPIMERKERLSKLTSDKNDILEVIKYTNINFDSSDRKTKLEDLYDEARNKRNEGLMIKEWHKNAIYLPGTRKLWYKLKSFSDANLDTLDLILVGAYKGEVN